MSTVRQTKLSVKQKCEIAQRELDDLRKSSKKKFKIIRSKLELYESITVLTWHFHKSFRIFTFLNQNLREELDKTRNETEKQMDTIKNAIEENDEQ